MTFSMTQRTLTICLVKVALLGLLTLCTYACATSRKGLAEVRDQDGIPCFNLAASEYQCAGKLPIWALEVSDLSTKPVAEVWRFVVAKSGDKSIILSPEQCLPYGQNPPNFVATEAKKLEINKVYSLSISAERAPSDPTLFYSAKFCLTKIDGKTMIHQIQWDEKQERWRYDVCKP